MSNKKYRLLKDIDTPAFICKKGTVGERDNTLHRFKVANNPGTFDLSDEFIQNLEKSVFEQWFQEVVEPGPLFDAAKINESIAQLEIEEKAFNAGRALWAKEFAPPSHQLRYETFEEYKIETRKAEKETHKYPLTTKDCYTEADLEKARREGAANGEVLYSLEDVRKALHGEWGTGNAVDNVLNRLKNYKK